MSESLESQRVISSVWPSTGESTNLAISARHVSGRPSTYHLRRPAIPHPQKMSTREFDMMKEKQKAGAKDGQRQSREAKRREEEEPSKAGEAPNPPENPPEEPRESVTILLREAHSRPTFSGWAGSPTEFMRRGDAFRRRAKSFTFR